MEPILESLGDEVAILLAGALTGLIFGFAAERSKFCLRAATVELWRGRPGGRFAIWLLVFGSALLFTQLLIAGERLDSSAIRQLNGVGSLSGAVIGGLLFGLGMVMARGCASRLLVLSATGNMRALVTGLVLTVAAQASLTGALSPLREALSGLALLQGVERDLAAHLPAGAPFAIAAACLGLAVAFIRRGGATPGELVFAMLVGGAVAFGWAATSWLSITSFEPIAPQSVTFTGPSADTLMALVLGPAKTANFGFGLIPGVFAGSMASAMLGGRFRLQVFDAESGMTRYMAGAVLMGFGGMLAGGCAVGAGVTGGSVMATTAWAALFFMWVGAGLADLLIDRGGALAPAR